MKVIKAPQGVHHGYSRFDRSAFVPVGNRHSGAVSNEQTKAFSSERRKVYLTVPLLTLCVAMRDHGTKPLLIFSRSGEGTDHCMLFSNIAQRSRIDLIQPEEESRRVRVAPQVTKILSRYERTVVLSIYETPIVNWIRLHIIIS